MDVNFLTLLLIVIAVPAAFVVSSAAGLGGSLILVPALAATLGTKEGIALAALLLALNNIVKVSTYRRTVPVKQAVAIALAIIVGALLGAGLMLHAPESWVAAGVIVAIVTTFLFDLLPQQPLQQGRAGLLGLMSGACSGFSGTSGPLKGIALRSFALQRDYFVGAAATVSLAGDATKALVFAGAGILGRTELLVAFSLLPVMIVSTLAGRRLNRQAGERGFALLFWAVMVGYSTRLVFAL